MNEFLLNEGQLNFLKQTIVKDEKVQAFLMLNELKPVAKTKAVEEKEEAK